ncbi:MAG: hypothetical protein WDN50_07885 [Bradyrhizobium sp.]
MKKMIPAIEFPTEQFAPGVIALITAEPEVAKFRPVNQIGPVETRLVYLDRQRDAEWEVVKEQYVLACVCAFMQIELHAGRPILRDHDISLALDVVQKALEYKEHDLLSIFRQASVPEFRGWLSRYSRNSVVAYYYSLGAPYACVDADRDALVETIAMNPIWDRVHRTYHAVFVRWMHQALPELNELSDRDDIWRAAQLVRSSHHRFGPRFKVTLDHLRRWMGQRF